MYDGAPKTGKLLASFSPYVFVPLRSGGMEIKMKKLEDQLREGQYVSTSHGISMYPMLRNSRDMIVVKPINRRLKKYEVPLYKRDADGAYILHRVIDVGKDSYTIRGDNCFNKEYNIREDQILGILTEFYRGKMHIDCQSRGFKIYSRLAVWVHPIQMTLKRCKSIIFGVLSKIKHTIFK